MEIFVEEAESEQECLKKIHKKYGTEVDIVRNHFKVVPFFLGLFQKEKCEISFMLKSNGGSSAGLSSDKKGQLNGKQAAALINAHALRIKRNEAMEKGDAGNGEFTRFEGESYDELKNLIKELAEKVGNQHKNEETEHANIKQIISIMEENDFSFGFINKIISRVKTELSLAQLEDISVLRKKVIDFIADFISVKPFSNEIEKPVIVFVGPTGVGKTTSLAKLAAFYTSKLSEKLGRAIKVKVITTDMYRIGAAEQMRKYCEVMDIQLTEVDFLKDLRMNIDLCKTSGDIVLVDTTGRSPHDNTHIEDMQHYFSAINKNEAEIHLVISAVTKISDMKKIIESYKVFGYDYITVTKLDETLHAGNVISVLSETREPISYITAGQGVPKDIAGASKKIFLKKLKGFEEDLDYINKNFDDFSSVFWG